ncbi:MAG: helix-turn-helix domain-containing protein [Alphaproteobacteria bacterium]
MAPMIPDNDSSPKSTGGSSPKPTGSAVSGPPSMPEQNKQSALAPPEPTAPSAVGIALAHARRAKDKSIEQAAVRLRIKAAFLEALEAGDAQALPGHVYALGFVRSYAEYLDLDPAQTVQDYKQEAADLVQQTELSFPTPTAQRSANGIPLMVVLGALGLAGFAGWFATQSNTILVADGIPTPPGLSQADLTIISDNETDTVRRSPASPHIATALLDIARPKSPAAQTSPAPQLANRQPLPAATVSVAEPIPWPAYVLPLDVVAALKQRAPAVNAPPPTPVRRPVQDIAAAVSKNKAIATEPAKAGAPIAATIEQPDTPAPDTTLVLAENAAAEAAAIVSRSTPARAAAPSNDIPAAAEAAAAETASLEYIPAIPAAVDTPDQGHTYGQANRDARIVIAAEADIWIQIRDGKQNDLFTRLLRAGDSYRVPNRPDLLLFTGNAGGLKLTVDGKPIAPLGADGAIRRDVALNADRLLSGTTTQ